MQCVKFIILYLNDVIKTDLSYNFPSSEPEVGLGLVRRDEVGSVQVGWTSHSSLGLMGTDSIVGRAIVVSLSLCFLFYKIDIIM